MLELYREQCPHCGAHTERGADRCGQCHRRVGPPKASKLPLILGLSGIVLLMGAGLFAVLQPEAAIKLLRGDMLKRADVPAERPRWTLPQAEPASRAWAFPLEGNMKLACQQTWTRFSERKMLEPTLNFQLVGGTLEASRAAYVKARTEHTPFPRLTKEEVDDAMSSLGTEESFLTNCLVQSFEAVSPCAAHAKALNTADASECLIPPVARLLTALPYRTCAASAKEQRVRAVCAIAAERAAGPAAAPPAAPAPAAAPSPAPTATTAAAGM